MRIVDKLNNDITDPDLTKGRLVRAMIIKKDAPPIDDLTKFVYEDSDYEEGFMYLEWKDGEKNIFENSGKFPLYEEIARIQQEIDDAVCMLFEGLLEKDEIINSQDAAICELFELTLDGEVK